MLRASGPRTHVVLLGFWEMNTEPPTRKILRGLAAGRKLGLVPVEVEGRWLLFFKDDQEHANGFSIPLIHEMRRGGLVRVGPEHRRILITEKGRQLLRDVCLGP